MPRTAAPTTTARRGKRKAASQSPEVAPVKAKRRFRPGTVASREVRRYQKNNDLLIRHMPFQRLVRAVALHFADDDAYRFQRGAIRALQEAAEHVTTSTLNDANMAAMRTKRVTVHADDVRFVRSVRSHAFKAFPNDALAALEDAHITDLKVTQPSLRRLCRRAGIHRMNKVIFEEAQAMVIDVVYNTLAEAVVHTDHAGRKTITAQDIVHGLRANGMSLLGYGLPSP